MRRPMAADKHVYFVRMNEFMTQKHLNTAERSMRPFRGAT